MKPGPSLEMEGKTCYLCSGFVFNHGIQSLVKGGLNMGEKYPSTKVTYGLQLNPLEKLLLSLYHCFLPIYIGKVLVENYMIST